MRLLDGEKIGYQVLTYASDDGKNDGISVADKLNRPHESVFKTLVAQGDSGNYYVCVIPVEDELDLKKSARVCNEKKFDLIPVRDLQKITGYIRGGCSPIGMKRRFQTYLDAKCRNLQRIIVSGGKIGIQIELEVRDLLNIAGAVSADLIK